MERQSGGGVGDGGVDFASVADDAGVGQQGFAVLFRGGGDALEVPVPEGVAVAVAAGEDRAPGEAGLGRVEDQLGEEVGLIQHGHAPLEVVVGGHGAVVVGPGAAGDVG